MFISEERLAQDVAHRETVPACLVEKQIFHIDRADDIIC